MQIHHTCSPTAKNHAIYALPRTATKQSLISMARVRTGPPSVNVTPTQSTCCTTVRNHVTTALRIAYRHHRHRLLYHHRPRHLYHPRHHHPPATNQSLICTTRAHTGPQLGNATPTQSTCYNCAKSCNHCPSPSF